MEIHNDPMGALKLLNIAARVEAQSMKASKEALSSRIARRVARDPKDFWALCETIVDGAKNGHPLIHRVIKEPVGQVLLHCAIVRVSLRMWEEMWNDAYPDQFRMGGDGEHIALMSVWREKVRAMIKECHQEAILAMTVEEYFDQLTAAGASEELAKAFADWLPEIQGGHPPST